MMKKVNILIVDDHREGQTALQATLASPEYHLIAVGSGNEALKQVMQKDFAVILLDVQMPEMDGFEVATIIKTRESTRDIPIIFMSATNQDERYVYQGYEVGAVDYILKPFDPYILKSKVAFFVDIFKKNKIIEEQSKKIYENEVKNHAQALSNLEIKSLRSYQHLADSIPQIVFRLVADGSYEYFNKVWFEYTGLSVHTSFGMSWKEVIHPDDLNNLMKLFNESSESNNPTDSLEGECRILNKHGEFRWHLFRIHCERDFSTPEGITWFGTATDIEDRKIMEETQRFLAKAGEALISSLDYSMVLQSIAQISVPYMADWCAFDFINEEGKIENVLTGHRDHKKTSWAKKLHSLYLDHPNSEKGIKKVIEAEKTQVIKNVGASIKKFNDLSNEEQLLANELNETTMMIVPLVAHGHSLGAMTFATYESGKKYDQSMIELGEELGRRVALAFENSKLYKISQEAIEVRDDFLSIASHELNTPITSLKLQIQKVKRTLLIEKCSNEMINKFSTTLDGSIKQVDRLINLVQVLLDVSHIQSGKFNFVFDKLNVGEMVLEVIERHKDILQKSNCNLVLYNIENQEACWDKLRIEQVLTNLITNAIKYAPGKIELTVKKEDDFIVMKIKDYGRGIPANKLAIIFDRFERIITNESVSGLGLGLFIVKQIIEGHSGSIDIESKPDEGSCFIIKLPVVVHDVPLLAT